MSWKTPKRERPPPPPAAVFAATRAHHTTSFCRRREMCHIRSFSNEGAALYAFFLDEERRRFCLDRTTTPPFSACQIEEEHGRRDSPLRDRKGSHPLPVNQSSVVLLFPLIAPRPLRAIVSRDQANALPFTNTAITTFSARRSIFNISDGSPVFLFPANVPVCE